MTGRDVVDAVVRLGFDRQTAPLEAFLATCVEKRRGENKVKRAKRAKVVAAMALGFARHPQQACLGGLEESLGGVREVSRGALAGVTAGLWSRA